MIEEDHLPELPDLLRDVGLGQKLEARNITECAVIQGPRDGFPGIYLCASILMTPGLLYMMMWTR